MFVYLCGDDDLMNRDVEWEGSGMGGEGIKWMVVSGR